ncbi:MAG: hypothetical protein JWR17_101 [Pseudomonas sp.]|jgi:hypothetical protein|uniref:histidine kinase n=1 Tax=Pseudomonas sp. TaxID=306 RepID=UPI002618B299|nr:histidine kinase [Pseudomonas sp.]MDB6047355.1 hypothetical protein [Pseudomonas sp.]
MANPRLRILLVDEEHSRRLSIEKHLAGLGYHRVAPLVSLRELLIILSCESYHFDLVVINESVLSGGGAALELAVRGSPDIKNLLVYQSGKVELPSSIRTSVSAMNFSMSCPPDKEAIRQVMSVIDRVEVRAMNDEVLHSS